uniref:L1 transposable element RRM domain-containing protein n=1 Tax=Maylandia zebra TaxID=106582 RepID=A0A3P9DMK0_9CICH
MPPTRAAKSASNKSPEESEAKEGMSTSTATTPSTPDTDALTAEISKTVVDKISTMMENKFDELSLSLKSISAQLELNSQRISDTENRISTAEDSLSGMETRLADMETKVNTLMEKCLDLEGRSRRDNIVILNLKEGTEGREPVKFLEGWLPTLLSIQTKQGKIKIDRAHRSIGLSRPNHPLCQKRIQKNMRFYMRYPATLNFSHGGNNYFFRKSEDALLCVTCLAVSIMVARQPEQRDYAYTVPFHKPLTSALTTLKRSNIESLAAQIM